MNCFQLPEASLLLLASAHWLMLLHLSEKFLFAVTSGQISTSPSKLSMSIFLCEPSVALFLKRSWSLSSFVPPLSFQQTVVPITLSWIVFLHVYPSFWQLWAPWKLGQQNAFLVSPMPTTVSATWWMLHKCSCNKQLNEWTNKVQFLKNSYT